MEHPESEKGLDPKVRRVQYLKFIKKFCQDQDVEKYSHCHEKCPREFLLKSSTKEKATLIKVKPHQPSQSILKLRKKQFDQCSRYCSQQLFFHADKTRRKWISYLMSTDSLFCIPCLLFTDA